MNYIAAIFDMDGLLIDSERPAMEAFLRTCKHFDVKGGTALYGRLLGTNEVSTRKILQQALDSHIDQRDFHATFEQHYQGLIALGVPLMQGVDHILDYLDSRGVPLAVATSTHSERAIDKLEKVGILDRFRTITGGEQVANGKPAPDIYLKAASTLNADPTRCIALEDSPNGVKAAVAAGMHAIQIPQLIAPDEALMQLGHQVIEDLEKVPAYLDSLAPT